MGAYQGQLGLGIDLVEIPRMQKILSRTPSFKDRCFTASEIAHCDAASSPSASYAARFAAKEAVVKALGCGFSASARPKDIEIVDGVGGRPQVRLIGRAADVATGLGVIDLPVSLSHSDSIAMSCAVAIRSRDAGGGAQREVDLLMQSFSHARDILTDI